MKRLLLWWFTIFAGAMAWFVFASTPAYADNCGTYTDCANTANASTWIDVAVGAAVTGGLIALPALLHTGTNTTPSSGGAAPLTVGGIAIIGEIGTKDIVVGADPVIPADPSQTGATTESIPTAAGSAVTPPISEPEIPPPITEVNEEVEKAFTEHPSSGQSQPYATTQRLVRGNLGERLATEALAADGHQILIYKPSITGTNQGGIDIVTIRNGVVHLIDNKALTRAGNVSSVSALTTNFTQNLATVDSELAARLADPKLLPTQRTVLQQALNSLRSGNYVRAVTNANVARDTQILSGVAQQLQNQGIQFINVFSPGSERIPSTQEVTSWTDPAASSRGVTPISETPPSTSPVVSPAPTVPPRQEMISGANQGATTGPAPVPPTQDIGPMAGSVVSSPLGGVPPSGRGGVNAATASIWTVLQAYANVPDIPGLKVVVDTLQRTMVRIPNSANNPQWRDEEIKRWMESHWEGVEYHLRWILAHHEKVEKVELLKEGKDSKPKQGPDVQLKDKSIVELKSWGAEKIKSKSGIDELAGSVVSTRRKSFKTEPIQVVFDSKKAGSHINWMEVEKKLQKALEEQQREVWKKEKVNINISGVTITYWP